jgi:hypothetical protein
MSLERNNNEGEKSSIPMFLGWEQKMFYDLTDKKDSSIIGDFLLKNTK